MKRSFNVSAINKESDYKSTIRAIVKFLWPAGNTNLKVRVVSSFSILLIAKGMNVLAPIFYKQAIDELSIENKLISLPLLIILSYAGARFLTQIFSELREVLFIKVSQAARRNISLTAFRHLHRLSLGFHLERQTGGLSNILERGTRGVSTILSFFLFNILPTITEILMVLGVLISGYNIYFAVIIVVTISLYIFSTFYLTEWRLKFQKLQNANDAKANTIAVDSILNYETVKYFNNERLEYNRYDQALCNYEDSSIKLQQSLFVLNSIQSFIVGLGLAAVMLLSAYEIKQGVMTVGDFVLVNTYMLQLYIPLNFLGFVYRVMKNNLVNAEKLFELLDVIPEIQDKDAAKPLQVDIGKIDFNQVNFHYQKERRILSNLNFSIQGGEKIAFVGESGAGKSTIAKLLFRFYEVQEGSIKIDDQDLSALTQDSIRKEVGIVPQDTVLFNDSIFFNIQYGKPEASREDVIRASKMAKIHDFVEGLPDGYETIVGERGLKLSGGEKQRVAIARTILKDPKILIFDEATSALDSKTEKEIQRELDEVAKNRTTLVIAHRLSTITDANQIFVMEKGKVIEQGTHQELLIQKGVYAEMWEKQLEKEQNAA